MHTHIHTLLAEVDSVRERPAQPAASATEGRPRRKTVDSKDVYKAPPNPYLEQEEPEPPSPPVFPTQEWLGDVPIIDCFDEAQSRKKLDGADLIGVSLMETRAQKSLNWRIHTQSRAFRSL